MIRDLIARADEALAEAIERHTPSRTWEQDAELRDFIARDAAHKRLDDGAEDL